MACEMMVHGEEGEVDVVSEILFCRPDGCFSASANPRSSWAVQLNRYNNNNNRLKSILQASGKVATLFYDASIPGSRQAGSCSTNTTPYNTFPSSPKPTKYHKATHNIGSNMSSTEPHNTVTFIHAL
jgi:hypothetical protein